jgi:hypothetical protein
MQGSDLTLWAQTFGPWDGDSSGSAAIFFAWRVLEYLERFDALILEGQHRAEVVRLKLEVYLNYCVHINCFWNIFAFQVTNLVRFGKFLEIKVTSSWLEP